MSKTVVLKATGEIASGKSVLLAFIQSQLDRRECPYKIDEAEHTICLEKQDILDFLN